MERDKKNKQVTFVGEEGIKKFKAARVLIFGAGAVGTNLIINLSALGIGHLGVVDNDIVEERNLSIQPLYNESNIGKYKVEIAKDWVKKYNPHIDFKTYNTRLDKTNYEEIVKNYDILVDAFDTQESVILTNEIAIKTKKPIIYTGTVDMDCFVITTIPGKTPCHNCFIENKKTVPNEEYGAIQATGAIAAGLETMEVVKLILKKGHLIHSSMLYFNGLYGKFNRRKIYTSKTQKCNVCGLPLVSYEEFKE